MKRAAYPAPVDYGKLVETGFEDVTGRTLNLPLNPPVRLLAAFQQACAAGIPQLIIQVPGREMWAAAALSDDGRFNINAPDLEGRATFDRRSIRSKRTSSSRPLPNWSRYVAGALLELERAGLEMPGMEVVIAGEEPPGPRYHYAAGMAFIALCYAYLARDYAPTDLIDIMDRVQRDYIEG